MKIISTSIKGLFEICPVINGDDRGWFSRIYDSNIFKNTIPGFNGNWVQVNHSFSRDKFTWRGFHFQKEPYQEVKMVKCVSGRIIDYVLDLRENSETYLKIYSTELSKDNGKMIYIPKGCAHGFLTQEANTELIYFHDEFYNSEFESGVKYYDKKISLKLPAKPNNISNRDKNHPDL